MTKDDVLFGYRLQLFAEAAHTSATAGHQTTRCAPSYGRCVTAAAMTASLFGPYQTPVKPCATAPCSQATATTSRVHAARSIALQPTACISAQRSSNRCRDGARAGSLRTGVPARDSI